MISLRTHNILDYAVGLVLIFIPGVMGFFGLTTAQNIFIYGGVALILYSAVTNYQYAAFRWITVGAHMLLDALLGLTLMVAPSLFGYRDLLTNGQAAAHYVLGLVVILLVALTEPQAEAQRRSGTAKIYDYYSEEKRKAS